MCAAFNSPSHPLHRDYRDYVNLQQCQEWMEACESMHRDQEDHEGKQEDTQDSVLMRFTQDEWEVIKSFDDWATTWQRQVSWQFITTKREIFVECKLPRALYFKCHVGTVIPFWTTTNCVDGFADMLKYAKHPKHAKNAKNKMFFF